VIEAHSMQQMIDPSNLQRALFNPLAAGGAPCCTRSEKHRAVLIAVANGF
jgi:hypothetical protein